MAIFGIAPKQNLTRDTFFVISTSNLEHNLFRRVSLISISHILVIILNYFCDINFET